MHIDIRKEGALIDGFKPEYHWCGVGCCSGDTPTPPGPEPPGPDTGTVISSLTIVVADVITESGNASAIFSPVSADTLLVYSSSDEDLATIDRITGEITVNDNGFVTFCVRDLYSGLQDCKLVEVKIEEPGPGPEPGETGITSIEIIVADIITDEGMASAIYEPSNEEVSLYYTSEDPDYATIDPITGEITVLQDGFVDFCVEDLLTGLKDCKEVEVKKSVEPGPEPPEPIFTGCTDEYRIKATYNVKTTTGDTFMFCSIVPYYNNGEYHTYKNWVTKVELEDGTDITAGIYEIYDYESGAKHKCYKFAETGDTTVFLTININALSLAFYHTPDLVSIEIPCNIDYLCETFSFCSGLTSIVIYSDDTQIVGPILLNMNNSSPEFTNFEFTWLVNRRKMTRDEIIDAYGAVLVDSGHNERLYTFEEMFPEATNIEAIYGPSSASNNKLLIAKDGTLVCVAKKDMVECVIPSGVTRIGTMAFTDCPTLERVVIPNTVRSIGWGAFKNCTSLKNVVVPSSVKNIAEDAFANCTALTGITLSNGVENIGCGFLKGCTSITAVTIPDSVTGSGIIMEELIEENVGPYYKVSMFNGCTGLQTLVLGSGVKEVKDHLTGCDSLVSITCKSTTAPTLGSEALRSVRYNNGTLYYPAGSDYSSWLSILTTWTGQEINDI